ncbi:ankyrin repeat-containing domain protein [Aspergillus keveii]|uniref:Ankyrin repeat-containing domain protein n=1 Tax=Aspergillus keveii TaxID=714993 RepID=A0ABR4FIA7_9EURO
MTEPARPLYEQEPPTTTIDRTATTPSTAIAIAVATAAKQGNTAEVLSLLQQQNSATDTDADSTPEKLRALALKRAAKSGHADLVAQLLKLGVGTETRETVLRLTARGGYSEVTKVLLRAQRTVPLWPYLYKKGKWMTGFLDAVAFGHLETVKVMLDAGLSANLRYQCAACSSGTQTRCGVCRKEMAIWLAVHNARSEIVKLLLARGARPSAEPKNYSTALHRAAERGDEEMVRDLLRAGWDPNRVNWEPRTPVLHAAANGRKAVFDILLQNGGKVGDSEARWIENLIQTRNSNALGMILGHLDRITFKKWTVWHPSHDAARRPLKMAVQTGDVAVTRCLLEYDRNHNVLYEWYSQFPYEEAFDCAVSSSNESLMDPLIEYCPWSDKQTREKHVFHAVKLKARYGHLRSVLTLIEWHYEFGRCLDLLATALFAAVYHKQPATVRGLIESAGADPNMRVTSAVLDALHMQCQGWDGAYPLHVAARQVCKKTCKVLLEHGAAANTRDLDGFTPLYIAAGKDFPPGSSVPVLQVLLEYGADVEAVCGRRGETPIHSARGRGNIARLHEAGAKLDHQDERGRTALHWAAHFASYSDEVEKYEYLIELGADEDIRDRDGASAREIYEAKLEEIQNKRKCTCSRTRMRTLCSCNL